MRLSLRYQFMARAKNQFGEHKYQKVVGTREVDVAERSDAQAPMAFVFKEQMQKTAHYLRYDHSTGGLFLRHAKGNRVEARYETFEHDRDYPTYPMNKKLRERFSEIFGGEESYYRSHEYELSALKEIDKSDLDAADKAFDDCLSNFIAADGWLWRRVPEPVFHLYRVNHGWKTTLSFHPDPRVCSDRRHFHFGLHQYDEMIDWKARLTEITERPATDDEFTSMGVYEASIDGYAIDLEFALVDLVQRFSETSRMIAPGQGGILSMPAMPLPVLDAFVRARRVLEIPREARDEDVHAETVALLESIPDIIEAHPGYGVLFAKPSENAFQTEKWHSRPISIVPVLNAEPRP
ncbi:hypothetical protein OIU34_21985 [Pararhizobium sp. BT-229]|uniref:hypothetical protein n=1 Tax=Pararhizobium sp. BT-229 TaxID=2986923 RepID=UPI0021F790E6|nr:hypothetical protein [Pararhizobium sp. BT-229]MCV9964563.1 hypothetical protein [Pararhizobium sp. BT-229]